MNFVFERPGSAGTYLLVTDSEEDDAECLILKESEGSAADDRVFEIVEDETELRWQFQKYSEAVEDVNIEM